MLEMLKRRLVPCYARWRDAEARAGRLPEMLAECQKKRAVESDRAAEAQERVVVLNAEVVKLRSRLNLVDRENAALRSDWNVCKQAVEHLASVTKGVR